MGHVGLPNAKALAANVTVRPRRRRRVVRLGGRFGGVSAGCRRRPFASLFSCCESSAVLYVCEGVGLW